MKTPINHWRPAATTTDKPMAIIVIGAGPVGVRFVEELKQKNVFCSVILFGDEAYDPYNRVQLSSLLSRQKDYEDLVTQLPRSTGRFTFTYQKQRVARINANTHQVVTARGEIFSYDQLVIATGSQPHIPVLKGNDLKGVYSFRNMRDTESLMARIVRSRKTIIVGGGLLGLEAARAMSKHQTQVMVLQQADRLMNRQLDEFASKQLEKYLKTIGIQIKTTCGVRGIVGEERVEGVITREGETISCDTVLFCTGIKPAINLALDAGINVGRGITVNDYLQTSQQDIYALGECCEHKGMVYGIVAPGFEQAAVLADRFANGTAIYQGTQLVSTLKVVGQPVCSMGEVAEITRRAKQEILTYRNKKTGDYRKLVIHQGRLIGACAIGDWPESRRAQEAFLSQTYLYPWQRLWFRLSGRLWWGDADNAVTNWPESSIVCQCNQISRGAISSVITQGCDSLVSVGKTTGAGTVCGSCQPLIQNLLGYQSKPSAVTGGIPIAVGSLMAIIASCLFVLVPGVAPAESVQTPSLEFLWTDSYWKQVSGFSLVGLVTLGLFMSLRKRVGWKFLGNFSYWRILHVVLGVLALSVLLIHTDAHLGENLNRLLMLNFLLVSAVGALAGITLWWAGKVSTSAVQVLKKSWYWTHLLVVWPLPALLIIHILSVYYF